MTQMNNDRLSNLLPAVYRIRDSAPGAGQPLRALFSVIEAELDLLEGDIDRLYDNWFIETCDEWVVPYIGDLLGVRTLIPFTPLNQGARAFSQRSFVANTLAYRRRKGTIAVLEQIARDITGWPAKGVEFFKLLVTTQNLNHVRYSPAGTVDLRDTDQLELIHGPFEKAAHTLEVRHIDNGRGKYKIPNLAIFLWRLQSYFVSRSTARPATDPPDGRYRFNPLGLDAPLFNRPRTEREITQLAAEENVPGPLRRRPLYQELETRREEVAAGKTPDSLYFGKQPVMEIFFQSGEGAKFKQVAPEQILICDLSDPAPPASPPPDWWRPPDPAEGEPIRVGVDPVGGRLAFPRSFIPYKVKVSYAYGSSGDLGGGPYSRQASVANWLDPLARDVTWQIGVTQDPETLVQSTDSSQLVPSLAQAIEKWNTYVSNYLATKKTSDPNPFGIIAILDSDTYGPPPPLLPIEIPAASRLAIVAALWPAGESRDSSPSKRRIPGQIVADNVYPHVLDDLVVNGTAAAERSDPGGLILDGLLLEGKLTVSPGNLGSLQIAHSTLVPHKGGLTVESNPHLSISLERSICGPIKLPDDSVPKLSLTDCLVDGGSGEAITARLAATEIRTSTILGSTAVSSLQASNSIFTHRARVTRRQIGCVRFCYLPMTSLAPRRYRCQPTGDGSGIIPQFTSITYGEPGYGQLTPKCPVEILTGAEDEGEMGVFNFLQQIHREKNLIASLEEYLRFGLEAGVFFAN